MLDFLQKKIMGIMMMTKPLGFLWDSSGKNGCFPLPFQSHLVAVGSSISPLRPHMVLSSWLNKSPPNRGFRVGVPGVPFFPGPSWEWFFFTVSTTRGIAWYSRYIANKYPDMFVMHIHVQGEPPSYVRWFLKTPFTL